MSRREHGTGGLFLPRYTVDGKTVIGKTWWMQFYDKNGKKHRISARTEDRNEAKRKLIEEMAKCAAGRIPDTDAGKVKFGTARDAWFDNKPRKRRGRLMSAYTRSDGTRSAAGLLHIEQFFAGYTIGMIGARDIERFIDEKRQAGFADATIARNLKTLRAILRYASESGLYGNLVLPNFKALIPEADNVRQGFVQKKDFKKLVALLPAKVRPVALFQYATGCRTGAALKITWDDVSNDCREIKIPGEKMKNGKALTLALAGELEPVAAFLRKQFRVARQPIFGIGKESYRYHWNRACHKLGLGIFDPKTRHYSGLRPHDLRRTAVRNFTRAGVPRPVAMKITGHLTESIYNRYDIVETEDITNAMERVAAAQRAAK